MKRSLFIISLLCCCFTGRSQTTDEADRKVAGYLTMLDTANIDLSAKSAIDDSLVAYLVEAGSDIESTITAPFPTSVKERNLVLHNSADNKLRVYSWDTRLNPGGWAMMAASVIQWKTNTGTVAIDPRSTEGYDNIDGECTAVETIVTNSGKKVYLVFDSFEDLPTDWQETVKAYTIENDTLKVYQLFKTNREMLCRISYRYNPKISTGNDMHLGKDKKLFFVPLVQGDKMGNKYLVYRFDGEHFVFDKNAK